MYKYVKNLEKCHVWWNDSAQPRQCVDETISIAHPGQNKVML